MNRELNLIKGYQHIKNYVIKCGFADEINWQDSLRFNRIQESDFLRECAWVILCSGMRESIIRKVFNDISLSFLEWESAERISFLKKYCIENAMNYFGNYAKLEAIGQVAESIANTGFRELKGKLKHDPITTLLEFPFIGPVTSYHLAKNLGLPVAKADRHLTRISASSGYENVQDFCSFVADGSGDKITVVDIIFWRFATIESNYINKFISYCM